MAPIPVGNVPAGLCCSFAVMSSPNPLFRAEVLQAQQAHWLGGIRIASRPRHTLVVGVALVLGAALLAFALLGQATRKARVAGVLMPGDGVLALSSPQPGRVARLLVREGQTVQAGQLLAVLHTGGATQQGDTATLVAQSLQARKDGLAAEQRAAAAQAQQRQTALADRTRSLQTDITQAEGELESARQRSALAAKSVARQQQLAHEGFVSAAQVQTQQETLLDVQMRERNAQRNLEGLRREAQGVQADLHAVATQLQAQRAQFEQSAALLTQQEAENGARAEWTLTAPKAGTVAAVLARDGQVLPAGQTLLSLIPGGGRAKASPLQAELYAPSRTAGFIAPGQSVWLRMQAFPYQKFGMAQGQVTTVSRTPVAPQDLPAGMAQALLAAAGANEPLYRVTVALASQSLAAYGQAQPLRPGMTLDADVIQERRAIWEWVLEPLLAAQARWKIPSQNINTASPGGGSV